MSKTYEISQLINITIPNRIMRSATWENMADEEGHMTDKLYHIYEELAQNEVGLIITGYANVVKEEKPNPGMMGIYEDSFIEEYQKLTNMVHENGSTIVLQIAYGGTKTTYQVGERIIYAPSEVPEKSTNVSGKAMTKVEIKELIHAFADAGRRAKEAGFDGVEIHGAHTYLINQFLSPYYNQRSDEYGGSLENRMRFLEEIIAETRLLVGYEFPILVKLTATEFFEGGLSFEETRKICKRLEEIGVDALELSGNIHGKAKSMVGEIYDGYAIEKEGYFLNYANIISEEVQIPVITVGGFSNLESIEKVLTETKISYVALSRPLLAEPDLVRRWKAGDHRPVKCVRCSKCRTAEGNYCTIFGTL